MSNRLLLGDRETWEYELCDTIRAFISQSQAQTPSLQPMLSWLRDLDDDDLIRLSCVFKFNVCHYVYLSVPSCLTLRDRSVKGFSGHPYGKPLNLLRSHVIAICKQQSLPSTTYHPSCGHGKFSFIETIMAHDPDCALWFSRVWKCPRRVCDSSLAKNALLTERLVERLLDKFGLLSLKSAILDPRLGCGDHGLWPSSDYCISGRKQLDDILHPVSYDWVSHSGSCPQSTKSGCVAGDWVPDLTTQGVEPNPGPNGGGRGKKQRVVVTLRSKKKKSNKTARRTALISPVVATASVTRPRRSRTVVDVVNQRRDIPYRVAHREFITDVKCTSDFVNGLITINPGNPAAFPWLSRVALNFEEYSFKSLEFEYKPTCGSAIASTNNAMGTLILAAQYDSYDTAFATKVEMEAYMGAVSGSPAKRHLLRCSTNTRHNPLGVYYVRNNDSSTGGDTRMYDLGAVNVATVGMQADSITIGELHVRYVVDLFKPKIPKELSVGTTSHIHEWSAQSASAANPFGDAGGLFSSGSFFTNSNATTGPNWFTIPYAGTYFVSMVFNKRNGTANTTGPTIVLGPNITSLANIWFDSTATTAFSIDTSGSTTTRFFIVSKSENTSNNEITINGGLTSMSGAVSDVIICRVQSGINFSLPANKSSEVLRVMQNQVDDFVAVQRRARY